MKFNKPFYTKIWIKKNNCVILTCTIIDVSQYKNAMNDFCSKLSRLFPSAFAEDYSNDIDPNFPWIQEPYALTPQTLDGKNGPVIIIASAVADEHILHTFGTNGLPNIIDEIDRTKESDEDTD